MNVLDIKQDIQDGTISSFYIFAGDEIEIQRVYINKIAEVLNYRVVRAEQLSDVWQEIITPTMFDNAAVYVIRDDKDIMSEDVQEQIANGALGDNVLIHLITSVDKRTKWYKSNSDRIVVFERLSSDVLSKYVLKRITLNKTNCERFITMCENDYSRILLEIDKIQRYMKVTDVSADEAFEQLVEEGAIYEPPYDAVFDLVNAILRRNIAETYRLFEHCKAIGEANLIILSVLYNNAKQMLQVQACESDDICASTGLTKWQVKCAKDKIGKYRTGELVDMMRLIQKIQKGIITGQIEDSMSVEYLLVSVL